MLLGKANQNVSKIKIRADSQRQKCLCQSKYGVEGIVLWTSFLDVFWLHNDVKNSFSWRY